MTKPYEYGSGDPIPAKIKISDIPTTNRVFEVFVPGEPQGQPRARATIRAGHAAVYNPTKIGKHGQQRQHPIVAWKHKLSLFIMVNTPREPLTGPVSLHLTFFGSRPQLLMKKKANPDEFPDTRKPDADNLAKAVMDVMKNCGVYNDDAQVWSLSVRKRYVTKDSQRGPGVAIQVYDDTKELIQRTEP